MENGPKQLKQSKFQKCHFFLLQTVFKINTLIKLQLEQSRTELVQFPLLPTSKITKIVEVIKTEARLLENVIQPRELLKGPGKY